MGNEKYKFVINGKFLSQSLTGVQRYANELVKELDCFVEKGSVVLACPPDISKMPNLENIAVVKIGKLKGNFWEQITLPLYAKKHELTLINLCGPSPIINPGVVVLHDVTFKVFPSNFTKKFRIWYDFMYRNSILRAKRLITISHFSESEIKRYYPTSKEFDIIPNAWQHFDRIVCDENVFKKFNIKKNNYYFTLGSIKPNKNLKWIIEAAKYNSDECFIVAGSINKTVFQDGLGFDVPNNVSFIGYTSDEESKALMRYCKGFLFPSLYEGFGIPPLEAIAAGCKCVIVNDITIMHEIFDDSVSYIDGLLLKEKQCDSKVLEKYSWKKSAELLYKLMKEMED